MITRDTILAGFQSGFVRLINSPFDDGTACQIGEHWFYFGGKETAECSADEYKRNVPESDIVNEIHEALQDLMVEIPDEYLYYDAYLQERLAKRHKDRIVVMIDGGCLVGVFSDRDDLEVTLVDYDNIRAEDYDEWAPYDSIDDIETAKGIENEIDSGKLHRIF